MVLTLQSTPGPPRFCCGGRLPARTHLPLPTARRCGQLHAYSSRCLHRGADGAASGFNRRTAAVPRSAQHSAGAPAACLAGPRDRAWQWSRRTSTARARMLGSLRRRKPSNPPLPERAPDPWPAAGRPSQSIIRQSSGANDMENESRPRDYISHLPAARRGRIQHLGGKGAAGAAAVVGEFADRVACPLLTAVDSYSPIRAETNNGQRHFLDY